VYEEIARKSIGGAEILITQEGSMKRKTCSTLVLLLVWLALEFAGAGDCVERLRVRDGELG
jgi:hypothetical protein